MTTAPPLDAVLARLASLRDDGAWRFMPARWRTLQALARRLEGQPEGVRKVMQERLARGLEAHAQALAQARLDAQPLADQIAQDHPLQARAARSLLAAGDLAGLRRLALRAVASQPAQARTPLHQLNESLRAHRGETATRDGQAAAPAARELASARRFREAWARERAKAQVDQAVLRRPAQAGPLNSHSLVLESLALMRELSPDYLRHFMAQVEGLQWLQAAQQAYPAGTRKARDGAPGKTARRGKTPKST